MCRDDEVEIPQMSISDSNYRPGFLQLLFMYRSKNKIYSAQSAYDFQVPILGWILQVVLENVWKGKTEPKVNTHIRLLLQNLQFMADRLAKKDAS
jgi:hypothetical protein